MSWTLSTSGAAIFKAGTNLNPMFNQTSGATLLTKWSDQAEASINAITRRDWVNLSGSTLTNFKGILDDAVSDIVATRIINYDMSGYTSRAEATLMLNVIHDNLTRNLATLKDQKNQEVMKT